MKNCHSLTFMLVFCVLCASCSRQDEPFTSEMRFQTDSIANLRIRAQRTEIDSQCTINQTTRVPLLADSMYRARKAQMEEKLRAFKQNSQ
jgi:hypothetical protein